MRAGIDEVGTGALAGPVVVAAVAIEPNAVAGLKDSKMLSEDRRYELEVQIRRKAEFIYVASRDHGYVNKNGIPKAWHACMSECLENLLIHYQVIDILADNAPTQMALEGLEPVKFVPGGDDDVYEIQAASIVAKVNRDRTMRRMGEKYPEYGFEIHKGYGTPKHIDAIKSKGPSPIHRLSMIQNLDKQKIKDEAVFDRTKAAETLAKVLPLIGDEKLVSDWERGFLTSVDTALKASQELTSRQMHYLLRAGARIGRRQQKRAKR